MYQSCLDTLRMYLLFHFYTYKVFIFHDLLILRLKSNQTIETRKPCSLIYYENKAYFEAIEHTT